MELTVPAADGSGDWVAYSGGWSTIRLEGDATAFDGATLTLEARWGTDTEHTVKDDQNANIAQTARGYWHFYLGGSPQVRITVSGSSGACAANAHVEHGSAKVHANP